MTVSLFRLSKQTLSVVSGIDLSVLGANKSVSMVITSDITGPIYNAEATLPFQFDSVEKYVPKCDDISFHPVTRKKVNLNSVGPDGSKNNKIGIDEGSIEVKSDPNQPSVLPNGFYELYKG